MVTYAEDTLPEGDDTKEILHDRVEDREHLEQKKLPLVEMFGPTIQGEGSVIGQQTYFLRFGLCDYKCGMCDSLHAVLPGEVKKNAQWLSQEDIFTNFVNYRDQTSPNSTKWVTFSGGNPAIHDLTHLLTLLRRSGYRVNVETQGTYFKPWLTNVHSLTISPKGPGMKQAHNHTQFMDFVVSLEDMIMGRSLLPHVDGPDICFKIVIFDQRDLEFASWIFSELTDPTNPDCPTSWLFRNQNIADSFYLSLGNPFPPPAGPLSPDEASGWPSSHQDHLMQLINQYKVLYEDIQNDPILSQFKWLPQWHVFPWGNDKGH